MRNEYEITDTIQIMIDDGRRVVVRHPVRDHGNLTSPIDILDLNLQLLNERSMGSFIDPSAKVDSTARIVRSVVGRGLLLKRVPRSIRRLCFPAPAFPRGPS
jgi:dTDP-glucose pyrophosphorylase